VIADGACISDVVVRPVCIMCCLYRPATWCDSQHQSPHVTLPYHLPSPSAPFYAPLLALAEEGDPPRPHAGGGVAGGGE